MIVIGAGGLGCPALFAMAPELERRGMGVVIVDDDVVDPSNLHRQILHTRMDIGRPKVESARDALYRRWPELRVDTKRIKLTEANARTVLRGAKVVLDGTDSIESKFLVNDACVAEGIPLVHGGVVRWEGQLMSVVPGNTCYRCLFEAPPTSPAPTCEQAGVLGPAAGVIGALMADEALRLLDGRPALSGAMLVCDFLRDERRLVRIHRRRDCAACGAPATSGRKGLPL